MDKAVMRKCLSRGLDYLRKSQLPHGEWKTYISPDAAMQENCRYVSTTYITTFVLHALQYIVHPLARSMEKKALGFLQEEKEEGGIWRYFGTNRNIRLTPRGFETYTQFGIVPDLDDTACVSYALKKAGISIEYNLPVFHRNRNEEGLYYTWLMDVEKNKAYTERTVYMDPKKNDVCAGVNANILMYLGECPHTKAVVDFLNASINKGAAEETMAYFPQNLILYYLVSRAYACGAKSLEESKDKAVQTVKAKLGSLMAKGSVLAAAYAACIYMNYESSMGKERETIDFIANNQREDGSWGRERFCDGGKYFYGSEELTTALCLEVLARYDRGLIE